MCSGAAGKCVGAVKSYTFYSVQNVCANGLYAKFDWNEEGAHEVRA